MSMRKSARKNSKRLKTIMSKLSKSHKLSGNKPKTPRGKSHLTKKKFLIWSKNFKKLKTRSDRKQLRESAKLKRRPSKPNNRSLRKNVRRRRQPSS